MLSSSMIKITTLPILEIHGRFFAVQEKLFLYPKTTSQNVKYREEE